MEDGRFDDLARRWADPASRRGALRVAAGGGLAALLAALGGGEAAAACPRNRRCGGRCCPKGKSCESHPRGGDRCVRRGRCGDPGVQGCPCTTGTRNPCPDPDMVCQAPPGGDPGARGECWYP